MCTEAPLLVNLIDIIYHRRFLHSYKHHEQFESINPNIYGLVESLICSRATKFVGTFYSTYSGEFCYSDDDVGDDGDDDSNNNNNEDNNNDDDGDDLSIYTTVLRNH